MRSWMPEPSMILKVSETDLGLTHKQIFSFIQSKTVWFHSHFGFLEDSDYNPVDEEGKRTPPANLKKPTTLISSSSPGRPRRKVGRPRKYSVSGEGHSSKGRILARKLKFKSLGLQEHHSLSVNVCYRSRKPFQTAQS